MVVLTIRLVNLLYPIIFEKKNIKELLEGKEMLVKSIKKPIMQH